MIVIVVVVAITVAMAVTTMFATAVGMMVAARKTERSKGQGNRGEDFREAKLHWYF
jgi:hypothetical protein